MADHSTNYIQSIKLPNGTTYEIHDAKAVHDISDLGLSSALVFKGTKATVAEVTALTSAKQGDVWVVTEDHCEYVCVKTITAADDTAWERLGDINTYKHTHSATVTGHNSESKVTGAVAVPTISKERKYLGATANAPTVTPTTDKVLGENTKFKVSGGSTTKKRIKASASGTTVGADGTVEAVTSIQTTTDSFVGPDATFTTTVTPDSGKLVTTKASKVVSENIIIPKYTVTGDTVAKVTGAGSVSAGSAASWTASVNNNVLEFAWTANTPTSVSLPTFGLASVSKVTEDTANHYVASYIVSNNDVTVATGAISSTGTGGEVVTGITSAETNFDNKDSSTAITGITPNTKTVLTGVQVTKQPTVDLSVSSSMADFEVVTAITSISVEADESDRVAALTGVTVGAPTVTLNNTAASGPATDLVTIGTTNVQLQSGRAAAQTWTQDSGVTGLPVEQEEA